MIQIPLRFNSKKIKPFLFLPVVVLSACASKQDLVSVEYDVHKLRTESDSIRTQFAGSYSDVQNVNDQISSIHGRIAEASHKNSQAFSTLAMDDSLLVHKLDELESRLQRVERFLSDGKKAEPSSVTSPQHLDSVETDKPKVPVLSDTALLHDGLVKLGKKSYPAARESFSTLLKSYPHSSLADKAQFDLAETYFGEKFYEKAILEYQVVIAQYTKSSKRPAALYKQAISFEKTGDYVSGKARLKELIKRYPTAPETSLARKKKS